MAKKIPTVQALLQESRELRARLEESESTLRAIRGGDALVVDGPDGHRIYTLQGVDAESNRFRGEILAQIGEAVLAVDRDQRVTYLNPAAERLYGVTTVEALGRRMTELYELWPASQGHDRDMTFPRHEGSPWRIEQVHRTRDGRELQVELSDTPLLDSAGQPAGRLSVIRDITDRKCVERRLQESEAQLGLGMRVAGVALASVDYVTGTIHLTSEAAYLFGLGDAEVTVPREVIHETFHPEERGEMARLIAEALDSAGDGGFAGEHRVVRQGKVVRWLRVRKQVVFEGEGESRKPVRAILAAMDVTVERSAYQKLQSVLSSITDGLLVLDKDWRYTYCNEQGARMIGMRVEQLLGQCVWDLFPHSVGTNVEAYYRRAVETGQPVHFEEFHPGPLNLWVECNCYPSDEGLSVYFRDVTARKRAEVALQHNAALFTTLIEQAPMGVYVVDAQFRLQQVNTEAMPTFETVRPLIGRDFNEVLEILWGPEIGRQCATIFRHTLETGERYESPAFVEQRHDLGKEQAYEWETQRVTLPDGQHGVVCYFHDITARVGMEQALRASEERFRALAGQLEHVVKERTEELVQSQDRLRALAKELNLTEHRERKRLADELHDYLSQLLVLCRLNLAQMKRIGLSPKVEQKVGETEEVLSKALHYSRTLMAELSPPVLHDHGLPAGLLWLGEQMARRGLTVRVDAGGIGDVKILDDSAVLLFQSVRELLLNALKYAECREVVVRMEQADGRLRIEICDDGVGFDLVAADSYSPTAMSSKFGLFSIRERMKSLGGWFELKSSCGEGTTAALVMPLERAEVNVLTAKPFRSAASQADDSAGHQQDTKQIRVLLVDDHAMVRQGLRSVLDSYADIEVVGEAWNGEGAVEAAERLRPLIIVMDINMQKMNGIEATAYIKARHPEIIVIGMSVQAGGANEEAMKKAGASMLLTKEAVVEELYRAIRDTLDLTRKGTVLSAES